MQQAKFSGSKGGIRPNMGNPKQPRTGTFLQPTIFKLNVNKILLTKAWCISDQSKT